MKISNSETLDLAFEVVKDKHESTIANIRSLDIKSSVFMALFGVLLVPSIEILQWKRQMSLGHFENFIPVIITVIGVILCLAAVVPQKFKTTPALAALEEALETNMDIDSIKAQLYSNLFRAIIFNRKIAQRKVRLSQLAWWLSIADIIFVIFFAVERSY